MKKTLLSIAVLSFLLFGNSPQEQPAEQATHGGTFPQSYSIAQKSGFFS